MTAAAKHSQAMHFQARAGEKVRNPVLQRALQKAKPLFVGKRAKGIAELADDDLDFEALRTACEGIRNRTLADLDGEDRLGRIHLAEALSYRLPFGRPD